MSIFSSSEQLYAVLESLFSQVEEKKPEAAQKVSNSKLILCLRTTSPVTEVCLNGRKNPLQIHYGTSQLRPDVELEIPADLLHEVLLGRARLSKASATGQVKMRGPIWKTFVFEDLFRAGQALYPDVLGQHNISIYK